LELRGAPLAGGEYHGAVTAYLFAADAVVVFHLAYVGFVVLGGLLVLRWRGLAWLHVPAVIWGVFIEFSGRICPLTPLENHLRSLGGGAGYEGDFVERYLIPVLYPAGLRRDVQVVLGVFALTVNILVYVRVWRRRRPPTHSTC
jgi:hypothetical protein